MALDPYIARGMPDLGANALAQVQQGRENKRQNALLDLNQQRLGMEQQRFGAEQEAGRREKAMQAMSGFLAAAAQSASPSEFVRTHAQPFSQGLQELGIPLDPSTLDDNQVRGLAEKFGAYQEPAKITPSAASQEYDLWRKANPEGTYEGFLEAKARIDHQYDKPAAEPQPAPLVQVVGPDGNPMWATREEAVGQPAYVKPTGSAVSAKQVATAKAMRINNNVARSQVKRVRELYDELKDTSALGPVQGRIKGPRTAAFDAAVSALQTTIRKMTRTAGEGSMSDWEGRLAQAQLPASHDWESVIGQKIDQLDDLISIIDSGADEMLSGVPQTREGPKPAPQSNRISFNDLPPGE